MACDHEHVSAGEKETRKPVEPSARNTDNFSILSSVLSRSTLHFRVHILIRKVCRIVSETSVFRLDHRGSIRREANVSNQPRSFFEKRSILTRVDESCLPFAWNVSIYLGEFRFRDVSTHGTNRAKNGFDRWAKNLEEERKGKRRKKKKRLGLEWLIELEKRKLMRGAGERLGNSISSRRQMFRCDSFLSSSSSSNASFFPSRQETITDEREWNLDGEIGKEGGGYLGFTVLRREPIEREPHRRDEFETAETIGCDR